MVLDQQGITSLKTLLEPFADCQSGLLPALHSVQAEYGFIDPAFYSDIADAFNLSQAEIKGVVGFYHDFKTEPRGKHTLRLCQAEACQSVGALQLVNFVKDLTGLALGETAVDGSLSVEAVYCLGLCATGPAGEIDGKAVARMNVDKLKDIVATTNVEQVS